MSLAGSTAPPPALQRLAPRVPQPQPLPRLQRLAPPGDDSRGWAAGRMRLLEGLLHGGLYLLERMRDRVHEYEADQLVRASCGSESCSEFRCCWELFAAGWGG